jgi:BlaI family penicillinase repressor
MKNGKEKYQALTKGEMDIMNKLWSLGREASTKELLEICDEPKPAYTTIATFLKILSVKGFVSETKYKV